MRFEPTPIDGAWTIALEPQCDARGSFVRTFDEELFARHGIEHRFPQQSEAVNERAGTIRGLHLQTAPYTEAKLIRCLQGAIYDVLIDAREGPGYGRVFGVELRAGDGRWLFCPRGVAHGYQTLCEATTVAYAISAPYVAAAAVGFHWQSPALGIRWPLPLASISDRDAAFPAFDYPSTTSCGTAHTNRPFQPRASASSSRISAAMFQGKITM